MQAERDVLVLEDAAGPGPVPGSRRGRVLQATARVARGELVAVLGRAGAGKSALLALCGGLERPESGRVLIGGLDLAELEAGGRESLLRRTVGWVFQSPRLVPLLTAEENVSLAMRLAGETAADLLNLSLAALDAVGLADRAQHRVTDLSRGERQRVALARALVKAPALILADEPTAQLDSRTGAEIMALLREAARSDVAVLLTTHDEDEARTAQRCLVMEDGVLRPLSP
jgi:putative ABC transport system ATP-binding protein